MNAIKTILDWLTQRIERLLAAPGSRGVRKERAGQVALIILGVFLVWATIVPLSKGIVAPGTVVVDSKRKTIQHLEGGVIKAIHVKEGARVEAGAILLELDDTKARAERDVIRSRFLSKLATVDRLNALIGGKANLVFSQELEAAGKEAEVAELMRMHQSVYRVLRSEQEGKRSIAKQRVGQLEQKLQGLEAYRQTTEQQVKMLGEEVKRLQRLHDKRLVESAMMAERMQQLSQQQGELGKTVSGIAETKIAIGEAKLNDLQIAREWHQDLSRQLSEAQEALVELRSQRLSAESVLARTIIKAPITGMVLALKATTIGGVVTTGNPIMDVVPEGDLLVIDAHVRPLDVDSVQKGMKAHVKFTSFKAKTTPELEAVIDGVSADVLTDANKAEPYYLMRAIVPGSELKKLNGLEILPGMPAEVYADGGSRTLLQYLFDPITSLVRKGMRED